MRRPPFAAVLALVALAVVSAPARPQAEPPEPAPEPVIEGAPAAFGSDAVAEERVAVPEGTALREQADARAPSLATIDAPSELPVIERSGPWLRVRYGALVGWVALDEPPPPESPASAQPGAHGMRIPAVAQPRSSDAEPRRRALEAAEAWAGPAPASGRPRVGGWPLFTDVDDPKLVQYLDRLAANLAELYRDRYDLAPGAPQGEAVVLFAREEDYREFAASNAGLLGIGEGGHAGHGVAALYSGSRSRDELAALLVHELTHLMNARALGLRTPPWLEEGIANDLGFSQVGRNGRLDPGTVGGTQRRQFRVTIDRKAQLQYSWDGAKGAMVGLRRSLENGELPSLESLLHLSWHELVDPGERSRLYAESTFFVRYLLARDPDAFRRYLRRFVAGAGDDPDLLLQALATDWAALDEDFRRWFEERFDELRLVPEGASATG